MPFMGLLSQPSFLFTKVNILSLEIFWSLVDTPFFGNIPVSGGYPFLSKGFTRLNQISSSGSQEKRTNRRRIKTEAKAKVVASVWGAKCIQFLAALAIFD